MGQNIWCLKHIFCARWGNPRLIFHIFCSLPRLHRGEHLAQGAADLPADPGAGGDHFRGAGGVFFQVGVVPVGSAHRFSEPSHGSRREQSLVPALLCCQHEQKELLQNYTVCKEGLGGNAAAWILPELWIDVVPLLLQVQETQESCGQLRGQEDAKWDLGRTRYGQICFQTLTFISDFNSKLLSVYFCYKWQGCC